MAHPFTYFAGHLLQEERQAEIPRKNMKFGSRYYTEVSVERSLPQIRNPAWVSFPALLGALYGDGPPSGLYPCIWEQFSWGKSEVVVTKRVRNSLAIFILRLLMFALA